ncbi:MAG: helix-hairpin-helix domain-containing protein, partial [Actinomycetota bacterium]|nr:helix-hairpin-helix domain-containing protein [Actinomycetota bacterium]
VRTGRVRELRGIGAAIESKLRELVETGRIAELEELERRVSPEVVGFGRYLGLTSERALAIAESLGVSTADAFRAAIRDGRLRDVPGIGPKTESRLREALERPREARRGRALLLNRARELLARVADALEGEPAGDPRRFVDAPEKLAVVVPERPGVVEAFAALPDIVALAERGERGVVGVTAEGIPVELVLARPTRFGTELVRATGSSHYVEALEPLPPARTETELYRALGIPFCPPELRGEPFRGEPPQLVARTDLRGDLHCHSSWSDGRASVLEMGLAARDLGYEYLAICDHTPSVRVVPGVTEDDLLRQGEEIAAANAELAPFRLLRGVECDILPDGSLDLPDDVLGELDWVTASLHAGQRRGARELTKQVTEAMRHPAVRALSHPTGRLINHRPPNALDLDETFAVAVETGVALEVNGLPDRLDLSGEHVHRAIDSGARIVVNTDAHSVRGLANIELALGTARRGWATEADVVNTLPLAKLLAR